MVLGEKEEKVLSTLQMAEMSSGSANADADGCRLPSNLFFLDDFGESMDDFLLDLIPSINESALPSTEDLVGYLSQENPINTSSVLESIYSTDPTKIFSTPHESNNICNEIIPNVSEKQDGKQNVPGDMESEAVLFGKMMDSLHSLDDSFELTHYISLENSHQPEIYKNSAKTNLDVDEINLQSEEPVQNLNEPLGMEFLPLQPITSQQNISTDNYGTLQQTLNFPTKSHESNYSNDLHRSIKRLKLSQSPMSSEMLMHKNMGAGVQHNNLMKFEVCSLEEEHYQTFNQQQLVFPTQTQKEGDKEIDGNKRNLHFSQSNEIVQPTCNNQSQLFEQNYYSVQTPVENQSILSVKQTSDFSNENFTISDQQRQTSLPMDCYWPKFNDTKTDKEWQKSPRPISIAESHPEDFDKLTNLSFDQFTQICRYDLPHSILQRVNKKGESPVVGGNQIVQVYNNTTHRSNVSSPSQSCKDENGMSKEELVYNRGSVIIRNRSILGKRTEGCSSNGSYGEGTYEDIGTVPCKVMKMSESEFGFPRGNNYEHNQLGFFPIQEIKSEVMDFSSSTSFPSTSAPYTPAQRSVSETSLMREHRIIRSELSTLLERIDLVILQKGVKDKSPKTEELEEVDLHDEKKLKKSVDTLKSYFKEALSLYAKYEGSQITKDELSREAKRLKNKFSGMKSRVKKKKEFICEKKEFFHLVHEFKHLKSLSDELENFQNLVVRELDSFNRSSPLGKFFLRTVFSQIHTSNVDSWIEADFSESVKKLENL